VLYILFIFIYLYTKPTHKTVYTMDIKRHNVCCWYIIELFVLLLRFWLWK